MDEELEGSSGGVDKFDEHCTYEELIKGFEDSNQPKEHQLNLTSDSLFDCINELNLNDEDNSNATHFVAIGTIKYGKKTKTSQSSRSSTSSDSSGVSSGAGSACGHLSDATNVYLSHMNRSNCFQLTPPLANLLPMPSFACNDLEHDDTVTKKSPRRKNRRKQSLGAHKQLALL